MRKYYAGINTLIRRLYACSCYVTYLGRIYRTWAILVQKRVSYNNSCRRLLRLPMRNSAIKMFVQCNIFSFGELLRKSIFAFRGRIQSSNNTIIQCLIQDFVLIFFNFRELFSKERSYPSTTTIVR